MDCAICRQANKTEESKSVSNWSLLQLLPPGSCLNPCFGSLWRRIVISKPKNPKDVALVMLFITATETKLGFLPCPKSVGSFCSSVFWDSAMTAGRKRELLRVPRPRKDPRQEVTVVKARLKMPVCGLSSGGDIRLCVAGRLTPIPNCAAYISLRNVDKLNPTLFKCLVLERCEIHVAQAGGREGRHSHWILPGMITKIWALGNGGWKSAGKPSSPGRRPLLA